MLENDSYAKGRVSQILEECHSNSMFFNKYIENQYDSLELDKVYFAKKIALKATYDYDYRYYSTTDEKGVTKRVSSSIYIDANTIDFNVIEPWNNKTWEIAKLCFESNKDVYNPIQQVITDYLFRYKNFLINEEKNIKKTSFNFNFENVNHSFYTYDKTTFLNNLSLSKKNYNLAKSLLDLESKKTQIETLQSQNKKKTLFAKYQIVYKDFNSTLQNNTELATMADNIGNLNLFLDKVIALYSQDTKELEKQLKNAETVESIKAIILI